MKWSIRPTVAGTSATALTSSLARGRRPVATVFAQLDALFQAFCECDDLMAKLVEDNPKGYIVQTQM